MSLIGRLIGRRPRWVEAWQTYPGVVGDLPAVWSVDLGAVAAAPVARLPVRLDVEVRYPTAPDGLPADLSVLAKAEEAVRACATTLGGAYVGRVAGGGVCRFTSHVAAGPSTPVTVEGLPEAQISTEYDPHWAIVRNSLAPDEHQHQLLADLAVLKTLAEHGDVHAMPRDIQHVATFAELESAQQAATVLRGDGFATTVERDDEGGYELIAVRRDAVTPPAVHDLAWAVKESVERHGGSYDGWHCQVTSAT